MMIRMIYDVMIVETTGEMIVVDTIFDLVGVGEVGSEELGVVI